MDWVVIAAMKRRIDLLEAIESLQAGAGDFVDHKRLAEMLNLDLQLVEDELNAMEKQQWVELKPTVDALYVVLDTIGRRILRKQVERRMQLPKAREAQQWILQLLMDRPPRADARWTTDTDLARVLDLDEQFLRDNLDELMAQGLVQLHRTVEGRMIIEGLTGPGRLKAREPGYTPYRPSTQTTNISTGGGHYVDTGGGDYADGDIDKRQITRTNDSDNPQPSHHVTRADMDDDDEIAKKRRQLKIHKENLAELRVQAAQFGISPPLNIINGIKHEEAQIKLLENELGIISHIVENPEQSGMEVRAKPVAKDKLSPPTETADSIEGLRTKHNVRKLDNLEDQKKLIDLPNDVFGYIDGSILSSFRISSIGNYVSLYQAADYRNSGIEIHKTIDGFVTIVGFVSSQVKYQLLDTTRNNVVDIMLFIQPYRDFNALASIPVSRVSSMHYRKLKDAAVVIDMKVL